jgi:hypothetical protein
MRKLVRYGIEESVQQYRHASKNQDLYRFATPVCHSSEVIAGRNGSPLQPDSLREMDGDMLLNLWFEFSRLV